MMAPICGTGTAGVDVSPHSRIVLSSARFGGALHQFACAECPVQDLGPVLGEIEALCREHEDPAVAGHILRVCVFLRSAHLLPRVQALLCADDAATAGAAKEWVIQAQATGAEVSLQVWRISGAAVAQAVAGTALELHQGPVHWLLAAPPAWQAQPMDPGQAFDGCLDEALAGFRAHGYLPADMIRTWMYIGDINDSTQGSDNYQAINEARRIVFASLFPPQALREHFSYPASTCVGAARGTYCFSALACKTVPPYKIVSLENRNQVSAFHYPAYESRVPPLFSRAVAVLNHEEAIVFISGTASIVGAKSVHLSSVEEQAQRTLVNVDALLQEAVLAGHGCHAGVHGLAALRACAVYVKRPQDVGVVEAICRERLPAQAVVSIIVADVCRAELLVEMEAIAVLEPGTADGPVAALAG